MATFPELVDAFFKTSPAGVRIMQLAQKAMLLFKSEEGVSSPVRNLSFAANVLSPSAGLVDASKLSLPDELLSGVEVSLSAESYAPKIS